jgi:ABC-2 type transport system ATP-binding protein
VVVVGRGKVIADTSVAKLLATASGDRVTLRTNDPAARDVLLRSGAQAVTATGEGTLTVAGLAAEAVVAALNANAVGFSEVSAHRATLEPAYLELTRDAVEFRAAPGQVTR